MLVFSSGYVVQGSNGEYVYLSSKERIDMVEFVRKEIPKDKLIIAGSGCEGINQLIVIYEKRFQILKGHPPFSISIAGDSPCVPYPKVLCPIP